MIEMNRNLIVAARVISVAFLVVGQTTAQNPPSLRGSEKAVKELEGIYAKAVMSQDVPTLERILADDFVAISSRGEVRNKVQEIDDIKPNPDYKLEDFFLADMNVRVFGTAAVVTGRSTLKASFKGKSSTSNFRYSRVYAKRRKRWEVVSQQLTRMGN